MGFLNKIGNAIGVSLVQGNSFAAGKEGRPPDINFSHKNPEIREMAKSSYEAGERARVSEALHKIADK